MEQEFDHVVLGAGLRGLTAALQAMRAQPDDRLLVIETAPRPGGSVLTQRSNGFTCELGPFAFDLAAIRPTLDALERPPSPIEAHTASGHLFTGAGLVPAPVEPKPVSFATGSEELVQACRRDLGPRLRLGRAATAVLPDGNGWRITLGGEVPSEVRATRLTVTLPLRTAATLFSPFDLALPAVVERLATASCAFAFFGGDRSRAPELTGYGIVPADGVDATLREAIFCDRVFDGRAMAGRCLVRCEAGGPAIAGDTDDAILSAAEGELRRWTGLRAPFSFTKVHRFDVPVADGAAVEARVRLRDLATRLPNLAVL